MASEPFYVSSSVHASLVSEKDLHGRRWFGVVVTYDGEPDAWSETASISLPASGSAKGDVCMYGILTFVSMLL